MNEKLLNRIINIDGFIIAQDINIDNVAACIRPLYIELLSLYPEIQVELANEICLALEKKKPQIIYAIEASILPIATLVAQTLEIPLSIVRKPYNYQHEKDEPTIFINDNLKRKHGVLLDDAFWTSRTVNHALKTLTKNYIPLPEYFFVFDFLDYSGGGCSLDANYNAIISRRSYWATYEQVVESSYATGKISVECYNKALVLFENHKYEDKI